MRQGNAPGFDVFDILLFVEGRGRRAKRRGRVSPRGSGGGRDERRATSDEKKKRNRVSIACVCFRLLRFSLLDAFNGTRGMDRGKGRGTARARTWRRLKRLFRPIMLLPGIVAALNWRLEGREARGVSARRDGIENFLCSHGR